MRSSIITRRILSILITALITAGVASSAEAQQSRPASPSDIRIPVSDARNIEPNSVRFAAIQAATDRPVIVLLGGNKQVWGKIVAATQQAAFEGCPVWGIFVGPASAPPALEIYAKSHHVTNPINPFTISQTELTRLIRDVCRKYPA